MHLRLLILSCLVVLAACEDRGAIRIVPEARNVGTVEQVFIGTTRGFDKETAEPFGKIRQPDVRFARVDVSIPPDRVSGDIDWPSKGRAPDPSKEFVALDQVIYDGSDAFRADLRAALAARGRTGRDAVIFVHGFNNTFAEGTYRLAQLGHDLKVAGVLVHYSWPSRANALGYVYDRDSALFARDGLERLIHEVVAAGAQNVIVVAHSMGGAVVMETLRQMAIARDDRALGHIRGVVLMSPDIDIDVFHEQAVRIGKLPQPFLIFTSKKDRALALSARLTGQRDRLGNLADPAELGDLKVTLVDTTAFSTGSGHFNVGNSPALLSILGNIVDVDAAFAADRTGRTGLLGGVVLTVQNTTQIILSPVTVIAGQVRP
jgi:esterase/lipase superfamily enzyme